MFRTITRLVLSKRTTSDKIRIFLLRKRKMQYQKRGHRRTLTSQQNYQYSKKFEAINIMQPKELVIEYAEKVVTGYLPLISGKWLNLGFDFKWNIDYVNEIEWKDKQYYKYNLKPEDRQTDVKQVWELSRMYYLSSLAYAYQLTNKSQYAEHILYLINHWIDHNPIGNTINWAYAMEVSIRASNIIFAIIQISDYINENNISLDKINNALLDHLIYINHNLEKGITSNNHYLSNLCGLLWISEYFSDDYNLRQYITKIGNFAMKELENEMKYQLYNDGFFYEDSTSYHVLNTEMILFTFLFVKEGKFSLPNKFADLLIKMLTSINSISPKFILPLIGDQDNGRWIINNPATSHNHKNIEFLIEVAHNNNFPIKNSRKFEDIGLYILENINFKILARCGRIGLDGIGGHAHNDQLSTLIWVCDEELFIDAGTGSYNGNRGLRAILKSTKSHNTIVTESYEQNELTGDLFGIKDLSSAKVLAFEPNYLSITHSGYLKTLNACVKRDIYLLENEIEIHDNLGETNTVEEFSSQFVLSPEAIILKCTEHELLINLKGHIIVISSSELLNLEQQIISRSYDNFEFTQKVVIKPTKNKYSIFVLICK